MAHEKYTTVKALKAMLDDGIDDDFISFIRLYDTNIKCMLAEISGENIITWFQRIHHDIIEPYKDPMVSIFFFYHLLMTLLEVIWTNKIKYSWMLEGKWSHAICETCKDDNEITSELIRFCLLNHPANYLHITQKIYFKRKYDFIIPRHTVEKFINFWHMYEENSIVKVKIKNTIARTLENQ